MANTYKTLKERNDELKRERDFNLHRASVLILAIMSKTDAKKQKEIAEIAEKLSMNYEDLKNKNPDVNLLKANNEN